MNFPAFLESIAKHFPGITPEDKQLQRLGKQKVSVWRNSVEWARNKLCEKGQVNGGVWGVWEITQPGKERLKKDLANLGITNVEGFVRSGRSISEECGGRWRPEPSKQRPRDNRRVREPVTEQPTSPLVERPITPEVEAAPEPLLQLRPDVQQNLLTRLQALTPSQFEHLVGAFLKAKGVTEVQVTGRSNDGGIDAIGTVPFLNVRVAVQVKRYAQGNNVGIDPIQRLRGSMSGGFERGVFITTSAFSPVVKGWVEETKAPITLVDGAELVKQMLELGLGVKTVPVVETRIDENFFTRLGNS